MGTWDKRTVISVLTQGKELANELKSQLHSADDCDYLVEKILFSYENALKLLDCVALLGNGAASSEIAASNVFDSPNSVEGSPRSEGSDHTPKKRKTQAKWSEQVRIRTGTGLEGQLDDGYNWRKYGQKDILGANHPRAYYRCTHRNSQGCLATKQVQRADNDPSVFEVVYRGKHTCLQERLKKSKEESIKKEQEIMITTNQTGLKIEAHELDTSEEHHHHLAPFHLNSTPDAETHLFSDPNNLITTTSCSPPFLSTATSESYFSLFGDSDFAEIMSDLAPAVTFPSDGLDLPFDQVTFDPHLIDAPGYF